MRRDRGDSSFPTAVFHRHGTAEMTIRTGPLSVIAADRTPNLSLIVTPKGFRSDDILSFTRDLNVCATDIPHMGGCIYLITHDVPGENLSVYSIRSPRRGTCANCSPSPPSDALYGMTYSVPFFGVYTQFLRRRRARPYAQTTCHFHETQVESWCVLGGEGDLLVRPVTGLEHSWQSVRITRGMVVTVPPFMAHQLRTRSYLSTCLIMAGHPKGICSDDHHFVESPPGTLECA